MYECLSIVFFCQKQEEIDSVSSGSVRPKVQFDVPATTTKVSPNSSNVKAKLDFLAETSGGVNQQQSRFVGLNGGPAPQVMMDHQINPIGKTTFPTASDSLRGSHYPSTSAHNLRIPPMSQFPPRPPILSVPGLATKLKNRLIPRFVPDIDLIAQSRLSDILGLLGGPPHCRV